MISELAEFIAIQTIANDKLSNQSGINFITQILAPIGFNILIEGDSPFGQPVIIAEYKNINSNKKLVLYGHYDVEKIKPSEKWDTPPFELTEKKGRLFCRGVADNKGILLARINVVKEMLANNEELPNILWVIQGEEEVAGKTPFEVIPKHFARFNAKIYLEETGVYKNGQPVIFHLPKLNPRPDFLDSLNTAIYGGEAVLANRCLNKFTKCPFLHNIPEEGFYIGFGPNDGLCNIHRENESLDKKRLFEHQGVFKKFLRWINTVNL